MSSIPRHPLLASAGLLLSLAALDLPSGNVGAAESTPGGGIRTYRARNAQGEVVLHVTNLDESGRRLGGELVRPVPAATPARVETRCNHEDHQPGVGSPIIVNIYPPAASDGGYDGCPSTDLSCFERGYAHYSAPNYWRRSTGHHRNAAPPDGLFGRPRAINTRPYSRGTASQRNRAYFRRN